MCSSDLSRYETYSEQYILSIEVEAKLVISIAKTLIYPAATRYLTDLATTIAGLKEIGVSFDAESAQTVATLTESIIDFVKPATFWTLSVSKSTPISLSPATVVAKSVR